MELTQPLLNKEEAGVFLKISTRHLDRHVKAGRVKPILVGKRIRFSEESLSAIKKEKATWKTEIQKQLNN